MTARQIFNKRKTLILEDKVVKPKLTLRVNLKNLRRELT